MSLRSSVRLKPRAIVLGAIAVGLIALGVGVVWAHLRKVREQTARDAIATARAALDQGRPAQALEEVESVSPSGPWEAEWLTVKGRALAGLDRPNEVRPVLERSLALDPNQSIATKVLAAVYFTANESDRGFAMLAKASALDPNDFRPWFAAGDMLLRYHNQADQAVAAFQGALARRPDHLESQIGLIEALLAVGSGAKASPLLDRVLKARPDDPKVLILAARRARLAGQGDEVNQYAERILAIDSSNPEALVLRAQYLQREGRPREALELAEQAVAGAPNDLAALNTLALIEAALGLKDRSSATSARHRAARQRADQIATLREEISKRPNDPEPHWRMGQVAAEAGMTTLAVNSFRSALALDPNCPPARAGLAALQPPASVPAPDQPRPARSPRALYP